MNTNKITNIKMQGMKISQGMLPSKLYISKLHSTHPRAIEISVYKTRNPGSISWLPILKINFCRMILIVSQISIMTGAPIMLVGLIELRLTLMSWRKASPKKSSYWLFFIAIWAACSTPFFGIKISRLLVSQPFFTKAQTIGSRIDTWIN